jgi:hypothetical protein
MVIFLRYAFVSELVSFNMAIAETKNSLKREENLRRIYGKVYVSFLIPCTN